MSTRMNWVESRFQIWNGWHLLITTILEANIYKNDYFHKSFKKVIAFNLTLYNYHFHFPVCPHLCS